MSFFKRQARTRKEKNNSYQSLEPRRLLAGDVRVFMDGDLFIRGDRADNQVEVRVVDEGDIQISGLNGTTINGEAEPMVVSGQNGRINGRVAALMRGGNDLLRLEGLEITDYVSIRGGNGDDAIGLYDTNVNGDALIFSGRGNDAVSLDAVDIDGAFAAFTFDGDDTIGVDESSIALGTAFFTGDGHDRIAVRNSVHDNVVIAYTGDGDDFLGTDGLQSTGFTSVFTGRGNDDVYLNDSTFDGRTWAFGWFGNDNLEVAGDTSFASNPFVRGFEGTDVMDADSRVDEVYTDLIVSGSRLGTITELAVLTPDLSTLVGALEATGLDDALSAPGPLTAFAPLNSAFDKLPPGTLDDLTLEELTDILLFHVSSGETFASELVTLDSVDTLLGQSFSVEVTDDGVLLNGNVTIAQTDIRAKNGVIHLLNEVLIPAS